MKTVRTNCFETNSSSTHSLTVTVALDLAIPYDMTFIPNANNEIVLDIFKEDWDSAENTPQAKTQFLFAIARVFGDKDAFTRIVECVEEVTHAKLITLDRKKGIFTVDDIKPVEIDKDDEDRYNDYLHAEFNRFMSPWSYDGDVTALEKDLLSLVETKESIKSFIFVSNHGLGFEPHNDNY